MEIRCEKCGYFSKEMSSIFNRFLCPFCSFFAPRDKTQFEEYINEKVDWRVLQSFRKQGKISGTKKRIEMDSKAKTGRIMSRAPLGYKIIKNQLLPSENSKIIEEIYEDFLNSPLSLNQFSKKWGFSLNGMKKILTNFTYIGKIKFNNKVYEGKHSPLISSTLFNHVQDKMEKYSI